MPRVPPTTDDLLAVDDELWAALVHADAGAVASLVDPEATVDLAPGTALGSEELVERMAVDGAGWRRVELLTRRARIVGELATVTALITLWRTDEGAPTQTRLRCVRTYRLGDEWVLIAATLAPPRVVPLRRGGDELRREDPSTLTPLACWDR